MDFELTLLTKSQIDIHGNHVLDVIKREGDLAPLTDFAILTGANNYLWYDVNKNNIITGSFILSSSTNVTDMYFRHAISNLPDAINVNGMLTNAHAFPERTCFTIRPVLIPHNFDYFIKNLKFNQNGNFEMLYGNYPQFVTDFLIHTELDDHLYSRDLVKTGTYFTIKTPVEQKNSTIKEKRYPVYRYQGMEYVHVLANLHNPTDNKVFFSDGIPIHNNDYYWIEVSPITWIVDVKEKLLVSKYGLISGIRVGENAKYDGNFKHTEIKYFLDNFMAEEIISSAQFSVLDNDQDLQDVMLKRVKTKQLQPKYQKG